MLYWPCVSTYPPFFMFLTAHSKFMACILSKVLLSLSEQKCRQERERHRKAQKDRSGPHLLSSVLTGIAPLSLSPPPSPFLPFLPPSLATSQPPLPFFFFPFFFFRVSLTEDCQRMTSLLLVLKGKNLGSQCSGERKGLQDYHGSTASGVAGVTKCSWSPCRMLSCVQVTGDADLDKGDRVFTVWSLIGGRHDT